VKARTATCPPSRPGPATHRKLTLYCRHEGENTPYTAEATSKGRGRRRSKKLTKTFAPPGGEPRRRSSSDLAVFPK
jgi:hypothetical protein